MTPPPITFAGKGSASTGHRRGVRKRTAPTAPRRVSGPKGGRTAAATAAREARAPRTTSTAPAGATTRTSARPTTRTHRRRLLPRLAPFAPRRTSTRVRPAGPLPARAIAYLRALPDHSLLDRIVRGRTWIAMLGVMLVGIVAMQVEELKLGASVGRGLSESAALQSKNQLLRANVSALADDQRIEGLAARMGMVMPAPGDLVFLTPHTSADAARAANQIQAPNPSSFLAALPQAAAGSTTGAAGLGATAAGSTTSPAGTTAGTTGLTTTAPASGGTTSTGAGALTGTAAGTTGTTVTGTTVTGTTVAGTTGTTGTTGTPGTPGTTGGASVAPVTTGNGTSGN